MSDAKLLICPYCGQTQPEAERCRSCGGLFEPLSRQATHNAMGPWFVRDPQRPFQPGCSYETLLKLIQRGQVTRYTIVRGPTTRQFWTIASRVPGLSHLFGSCHQCDASVDPGDHACHACGAAFGALQDRNYLGLPEYRPLPWEANERDESGERMAYDGPADLPRTAPPPGSPRGLSSFASDEELFGTQPGDARQEEEAVVDHAASDAGYEDASAATNGHPAHTATAVDTEPASPAAHASQPAPMPHTHAVPREDPLARPSIRSLERRLAQAQRSRQLLGVIALIAGVIAVTASIAWLAGQPGQGQAPTQPGTPDAAEISANDEQASDAPADDAVSADGAVPPGASGDDRQATAGGTERHEDAEPWTEQRIDSLLAEAQALLDGAADEDRDLAARISDAEQAVETLLAVRESPEKWHPDDIAARLTEARQTRDRLKLREFFP